jgi:hypothetical protein
MCEMCENLYYTITEEEAASHHECMLDAMHTTRAKNKIIREREREREREEEESDEDDEPNIERQLANYSYLTLKQLNLICDYYGITHYIRITKCNKEDIVNMLVLYESTDENCEIVIKRKKMWKYLAELKKDKFMKKFIIQ